MATRAPALPRSVPGSKKLALLDFDPQNPRLPEDDQGASQPQLLEIMARDYRIIEIGSSLADNGYFHEEPLVVMPSPETEGRFLVLEGNRRLAALKLIEDPGASPRQAAEWRELRSRAIERGHDLKESIPIVEYDDRDAVTAFLGFRHISGALKWEPLAKARFVHHLVHERHMGFREVAREIGSKSNWVKSQYVAYRVFLQARAWGIDTEGFEKEFSVFGRALQPATRDYIGVEYDDESALAEPVPDDRREELAELLSWIFGDDGRPPALKESRDLGKLNAVLQDEDATAELRANRDLEYAFLMAGGELDDLIQTLRRARHNLDESLRSVHRHRDDEKVQGLVKSCYGSATELARQFPELLAGEDDAG